MTLLFPQSWYILTLTNYKIRKKIAKQNMVQYDSGKKYKLIFIIQDYIGDISIVKWWS